MKILEKSSDRVFERECEKCSCLFEYEMEDTIEKPGFSIGNTIVQCPECKHENLHRQFTIKRG